jgi:hypothetical protein
MRVILTVMLHDEIRELLRELAAAVGAERVDIVHAPEMTEVMVAPEASPRRVPLGNRSYLEIELAPGLAAAPESRAAEHAATVERTVRALRAAARRWQAERLPAMGVSAGDVAPQEDRVRARIAGFLEALASTQRARVVAVTVQGRVVAASIPLDELERERLPFLLRRVAVAAGRQTGRSHADIVDPDVYLASFWFDACLVAFFSGPYAVDFFRHRARMVMRELSLLLPMLDEPPPSAANVAPLPPREPR